MYADDYWSRPAVMTQCRPPTGAVWSPVGWRPRVRRRYHVVTTPIRLLAGIRAHGIL